jgi:hypothetical protein
VHRFSGNNYKGYNNKVYAESRYTRNLVGERREMRRKQMKTIVIVMMLTVTVMMLYVHCDTSD